MQVAPHLERLGGVHAEGYLELCQTDVARRFRRPQLGPRARRRDAGHVPLQIGDVARLMAPLRHAFEVGRERRVRLQHVHALVGRERPHERRRHLLQRDALRILGGGRLVRHLRGRAGDARAATPTELEGLAEPRLDVGRDALIGISAPGGPFDHGVVAQPGRNPGEPAPGLVGTKACGDDSGRVLPRARERVVEREHGPEDRA
jgi:hypothetical protein